MSDLVCASCRHWHRQPIPSGQAIDMSQPAMGQCRERLHVLPGPIVQMPGGPPQVSYTGGYPVIPATMPICAQFMPQPEFAESLGEDAQGSH